MDEFLRIGNQEIKGKREQKEKMNNSVDKKRVARLKKSFLPYWTREIEYLPKKKHNINIIR